MHLQFRLSILLLAVVSFLLLSCSQEETKKPVQLYFELKSVEKIPSFNSDNAYSFIEKQVSFGPRNPNSAGHKQALIFLKNELAKYADEVSVQNFSYPGYEESLNLTNLIGRYNPSAKNRILLGAHWDTRPRAEEAEDSSKQDLPIIGANDGGSGVGVLLEVARVLKENKIDFGIDIVLFDGEDYGNRNDLANYCLGSKYFSAKLPPDFKPAFGILLDMVGDKDASFSKEGHSLQFCPDIVKMVWGKANEIGADLFLNREAREIYDDHVPLNQSGIRTINIIDLELIGADSPDKRRNYWHTHNDTMENISKETLQQVGDVLLSILYSLKFNY